MKAGLRVRFLGVLIGAILIFFIVSSLAARNTMSNDLKALGRDEVVGGANGFNGYWDQKRDQVRLLVSQVSIEETVRQAVASHNGRRLEETLSNVARQGNLSYLVAVDTKGNIVARANGGGVGSNAKNPYVDRALTGETVSTATLLDAKQLAAADLAAQVQTDLKADDGKVVGKTEKGLAIVAAAPISDAKTERTVGALYGGVVMNHYYDIVDQATHALGGKSALAASDAFVASTVSRSDGTRYVDAPVSPMTADVLKNGQSRNGTDSVGGVAYVAQVDPILDDQNQPIGARWYGVPQEKFDAVQRDTLLSILLWGIAALVLALVVAIPVVERIAQSIIKRSKQVKSSADELSVIVVGSEVSGDHVSTTRANVERQGQLIEAMATPTSGGTAVATQVGDLRDLNQEILNEVVVIDVLAQEMSGRMHQAVARVAELKEVSSGLNKLVTGSAS